MECQNLDQDFAELPLQIPEVSIANQESSHQLIEVSTDLIESVSSIAGNQSRVSETSTCQQGVCSFTAATSTASAQPFHQPLTLRGLVDNIFHV